LVPLLWGEAQEYSTIILRRKKESTTKVKKKMRSLQGLADVYSRISLWRTKIKKERSLQGLEERALGSLLA
jgi:hypothetical protein